VGELTEIGVEELPALFEIMARETMREHEKRFQERIKAVKDACSAVDSAASRFEAAVRNAWGTMDKSASEYGTRMAQTIEELARNLNRLQASGNYDEAERFHKESIAALNSIIKTVRKYVLKLRRGLRVEMAALNVALGKLEASIKSLGIALDKSPGHRVESIRRDILHLTELHAELSKLRADEVEETKSLEANSAKMREVLAKAQELAANSMFRELTHYEDALRAKEDEIRQFLQPIAKPLSKLERIASGSKNQNINLATLRDLIEKPVETVATGQPFALIQTLNHLGDELARGGFEIEERRRRRAEETIQQVREGMLEKLRGDYLTIQANVQETLRQLKATGLLEGKIAMDRALASIREEGGRLTNKTADLQRRSETIMRTILREKASIEQQIAQLTGKTLEIQTQ